MPDESTTFTCTDNHIETFTATKDAWRRKTGPLSVHAGIQQSEQHCGQTAGGTGRPENCSARGGG